MSTRAGPSAEGANLTPIALLVASILFIQNLDGAVIVTSLPQMAGSLGASTVALNTGITAYFIATAAFIPLSGWITDRLGAKLVLAGAILVFSLGSAGCAAAGTLPEFICARVIQGIGGAMMMPVGRIVVLRTARKDQLLAATSLITWPALLAPVVGPIIGGAITTWLNWRWNFLINLPLGCIAIGLVFWLVPDEKEPGRRSLDVTGLILCSFALSLLIYALDGLATESPIALPLVVLLLGCGSGLAATRWFGKAATPLLDLSSLKVRSFKIAVVDAGNLIRLSISATPFLLALMLQTVWKLNPLETGTVLLVYFVGNLAMKTVTSPLLRLLGFRPLLFANGIAVALSIAAIPLLSWSHLTALSVALLLFAGAARSMQFTAINTLTFADIPKQHTASSSTLASMMQQLSMALGVALAAICLRVGIAVRGAATPDASDFAAAYLVTALCALAGALLTLRLAGDAGAEVRGRPVGKPS
ncbi:DHA2 family efflux MFS transporter permease subunit [Sphingomonas oligophenolica]|uniref:MFS transporter n=1 Tax=Sphingomonas oligophenolica TaxID=301154 RepID=A0ABU9Y948_9SPHN